MVPPHLAQKTAADLGAHARRCRGLRRAPDRARRAARRPRFHLRRRVPARSRHGPARRRRFREGLLRRPGSGVAHASIAAPRAPASLPSRYDGAAPEAGVAVMAGDKTVGTMGSAADGRGLAMLRLDRVADALAAGAPIVAGGVPMRLVKPAWARFRDFRARRKGRRMNAQDSRTPTASSAAPGRRTTRSTSPITTRNGACRNTTTARCSKS